MNLVCSHAEKLESCDEPMHKTVKWEFLEPNIKKKLSGSSKDVLINQLLE